MKIILIGANGKIGELVQKALAGAGHEIVKVGRKSGDFRVEIENRESVRKLYQAVGSFAHNRCTHPASWRGCWRTRTSTRSVCRTRDCRSSTRS